MSRPTAVFFVMLADGHFQRLRPLISELTSRSITAYVFTDRRFETRVQKAGATFVDLFAKYPLERADAESRLRGSRYVSFTACYADEIIKDVEALRPSLVVYDTYAIVARVVAKALGIPYVNVCAGHNIDPARFLPLLQADPELHVSPRCHRAVEVLRDRYGLEDASPFCFMSGLSPFLNVYCEPAAYLTESERRVFEPIVFFGSLPAIPDMDALRRTRGSSPFGAEAARLRVYVSFGTQIWRFFPAPALDAMRSISRGLADREDVQALISLGGADMDNEALRELEKPNVSVASYVDQWQVLHEADAFVTHHGLNSTHEAIAACTPMISYPWWWDQPSLAGKCQQFGLAIPLAGSLRGPIGPDDVDVALTELARNREEVHANLARAFEWELQVIADRDSVVRRITALL
jgi:UDP:flavonoid glycosyltransferase YjiC (YdhE family)